MKSIFLSLFFFYLGHTCLAQDIPLSITDTEKELYFSTALIYEYQSSEGKKEEVWIYVNPKTGRMLFTKESWNSKENTTDEMTDFIVANPDGSYFQFYSDAEGEKNSKKVIRHQLEINKLQPKNNTAFIKDTRLKVVDLHKKATFSTLEATAFSYDYLHMKGGETLFVSKVDFNTHLLYAFSKLEIDAKLPIYLEYSNLLNPNYLVTQSTSYSFGVDKNGNPEKYQTSFRLLSYEPTTYYVPYKEYDYLEKKGEKWIKKEIPIQIK